MEITLNNIRIGTENAAPFTDAEEFEAAKSKTVKAYNELLNVAGAGNDFLGWLDLPSDISKQLISDIEETAYYLRRKSDVIVVVGIGGSYLGSRAVIEALQDSFKFLHKKKRRYPMIVFAGQNISEDYHAQLLDALDHLRYSVIVISKSGTTTEPAIAFRLLRTNLIKKYGHEVAASRVVAVTDGSKGALKSLADKERYRTFVIPDDVGGRYSVMSPAGLLPIACAGFDIRQFVKGAEEMETALKGHEKFEGNPAMLYAATRNLLYEKGKAIEMLVSFNPSLAYLIEWWKQLFGESEGKESKGIFPAGAVYSTDLHSLGQFVQEGSRNLFETFLWVEKPGKTLSVPEEKSNQDGLDYIAGKSLNYVNEKAMLGTIKAHRDGGVPSITVSVPELREKYLGALMYFFEFSCAVSSYTLGVNPFNQPGVEAYKKNMFNLLGK